MSQRKKYSKECKIDAINLVKEQGYSCVMDAWYSSLDNLKAIRSHGWIWVTTLRKN